MTKNKDLWDITDRPSTKTKLEILEKVVDIWLTIWNKQDWVFNEWYVMDLFAGRGKYIDGDNDVNGSSLIFLKKISDKINKLRTDIRFKIFLVEKDTYNYEELRKNVKCFINKTSIKDKVDVIYNGPRNSDNRKGKFKIQLEHEKKLYSEF